MPHTCRSGWAAGQPHLRLRQGGCGLILVPNHDNDRQNWTANGRNQILRLMHTVHEEVLFSMQQVAKSGAWPASARGHKGKAIPFDLSGKDTDVSSFPSCRLATASLRLFEEPAFVQNESGLFADKAQPPAHQQ
eukprot:6207458-Pleurochrysis_carterae.AAC.3